MTTTEDKSAPDDGATVERLERLLDEWRGRIDELLVQADLASKDVSESSVALSISSRAPSGRIRGRRAAGRSSFSANSTASARAALRVGVKIEMRARSRGAIACDIPSTIFPSSSAATKVGRKETPGAIVRSFCAIAGPEA